MLPLRVRLLLCAVLSTFVLGCSSGSGSGTGGGAGGGSAGTGGGTGACTTVVNIASIVSKTANTAAAPAMTGGTIAPGTYVKTAIINYATSTPGTTKHQETWVITASTLNTVALTPGDTVEKRNSANYTVSGNMFTMNLTCPMVGTLNAQYSATPTEIRFTSSSPNEVHVYTLASSLSGDGGTSDGGSADAGPTLEPIATGLTDLVDLELDGTNAYVLGNGQVRSCALAGCGTNPTVVVSGLSVASAIAVDQGTLFVGNGFRYISSCSLAGACTLSPFVDVGANSYPTALVVSGSRLYWISESGASRRIQVCPLAGCTAGYPKFVYQGTLLDGVPVSGFVINTTDVYVTSFTGAVFRIPLTDNETADVASATQISPSAYGTGGLDLDGNTLRWANGVAGKLESCTTPSCSAITLIKSGLTASPTGLRTNATHVYGIDRGTSNGSGGYVANTAGIWRYPR